MPEYRYRLLKTEVIEEQDITANSRDEAVGAIYSSLDGWIDDVDSDTRFEIEWLDDEVDL